MINKRSERLFKIVNNAMFTVISVILSFLVHIPISALLPFLKLDFSEAPIFIATLISGVGSGLTVLFASNLIRTISFSTVGWIGFVIRMTSVFIVLALGVARKRNINIFCKAFIITLGLIVCLLIKIPINYVFWTTFFGFSKEFLSPLMLTIVVPFNIVKITINVLIAFWLYKRTQTVIEKIKL